MSKETLTFAEFVFRCGENKALVAEFDRLTGSNLGMNGSGIDLLIDRTTGRTASDTAAFVAFVHEFVWLPLVGDGQCLEE